MVLERYAQRIEAAGGRPYLSGVDPGLLEQFRRTRRVDVDRRVRVFVATEVVGDASALAYRQGEAWLARDARD